MEKSSLILSKYKFIVLLILLSTGTFSTSHAQLWKKIENGARSLKKTTSSVKQTVREIGNTNKEVGNTVKSFKKTWTKDTSSNIKYRQIPDYRTLEEVDMNQKQALKFEDGKFKDITWQPVINFDNQIFPSFVISWNSYKGTKNDDFGSSIGFNIKSRQKNVVFKWEVECVEKSYCNIDSGYINCDELMGKNFMPKISWNIKELSKQNISTPVNFILRLTDPVTNNREEIVQKVSLRSINDCLTYYDGVSYRNMYVAYVNEDHPEIEGILKKAMETNMISDVTGYLGFDDDMSKGEYLDAVKNVDLQIAAIWRVLHDRGFQYSSITNSSTDATSGVMGAQTVRPFAMAMKTNQANCVDGSVMIASILKRMNFRSFLVLVPRHCFLAYAIDDGNPKFKEWRDELNPLGMNFIETTAMSNMTYLNKDSVAKNFNKLIKPSYPARSLAAASEKDKQYFLQFLKVKDWGIRNLFDKNGNPVVKVEDISFININKERANIPPLPIE